MTKDELKRQLIVDEGSRQFAYQDTLGYWTIGVGRNIDRRGGIGLSESEISFLLDNDIARVQAELDSKLNWWKKLNDVRQNVLMNMSFNLGVEKLLKFHNTLAAMQNGNYEAAADGMEESLWYKQVGARGARLAEKMRKGQ